MNYAALDGDGDGFGAVGDVEFSENALQVVFDGVAGDFQDVGNFLVRQAFGHLFEDLEFARGEVLEKIAGGKTRGDFLGDPALAGGDGADGGNQFIAGRVFQHVALRAGLHGAVDV